MERKVLLVICLLCLLGFGSAREERDGRRRSGRRKTSTIPPTEAAISDNSPDKSLSEAAFDSTKAPSSAESESSSAANAMTKSDATGKAQVLAPRGRKPRPMSTMGNKAEAKPKPTLPTFVRKMTGRTRKTNTVEPEKPVTPSTGSKIGRNSSRRRGSTSTTTTAAQSDVSETTSESTNSHGKKRFGGGATRRSRVNRRTTTESTES